MGQLSKNEAPWDGAVAPRGRRSGAGRNELARPRGTATFAFGAVLAAALWWRRHPSACPYGQRFWLEPPHPLITRRRLRAVLAPQPGEHILEVGPGTGYYTLDAAEWLLPGGRLEIFDLQPAMLDHTMRRARERQLTNITATRGDARRLPYADSTFGAAFLVAAAAFLASFRNTPRLLRPLRRLTHAAAPVNWHVALPPGGILSCGDEADTEKL